MFEDLKPTEAEQRVIDDAARGIFTDFQTGDAETDDPKNAEDWGEDRTIRAEVLFALATGLRKGWTVHPRGIQISRAKIAGHLNFEAATVATPLAIFDSAFDLPIDIADAHLKALYLSGSVIPGLRGDRTHIDGPLFLRDGFAAKGEVRLPGAEIGGNLECDGAQLENPDGQALSADGISVKGGVFLHNGFVARGTVRLLGAEIGGDLSCNGARLQNPDGVALGADGMSIKGSVFLSDGFAAKGAVRLLGAEIGGSLSCHGAQLENPDGVALSADRMSVKGGVFLRDGFAAKGMVRLPGAEIGGSLECIGAQLENPDGVALSGDGMSVKGNVFLSVGFAAKGAVRLPGAEIGGDLQCLNARFENPNGDAIDLRNTKIGNRLWLMGSNFRGNVILAHAHTGTLADDRESWPIAGMLALDGFTYDALTVESPLDAGRRIDWLERQPMKPFKPQPYEQLIKILRAMGHESDARQVAIAKQRALRRYGILSPRAKAWNWILDTLIGHGYQTWRVMPPIGAVLLAGMVFFGAANDVGGMRPSKERVYLDSCYTLLTGACVERGWRTAKFKHPDPPIVNLPADYPPFQVFAYSIDLFVPFVDLHQESYWLPSLDAPYGWFFRLYMWLHIALGWILTTIGVVGLTGIVKQD